VGSQGLSAGSGAGCVEGGGAVERRGPRPGGPAAGAAATHQVGARHAPEGLPRGGHPGERAACSECNSTLYKGPYSDASAVTSHIVCKVYVSYFTPMVDSRVKGKVPATVPAIAHGLSFITVRCNL
jgi:hypothetical protein